MKLTSEQRRIVMTSPAGWIASGFGAGLAPLAPGTVGSLVALAPYLAMRKAEPIWFWAIVVVVFVVGVRASDWVCRSLVVEDPGVVVIDEWVGQWITLGLIELALLQAPQYFAAPPLWLVLLVGFLAFRVCDILKPWPASLADRRLHGGFGAMLDDAIAGVWAAAVGLAALAGLQVFL